MYDVASQVMVDSSIGDNVHRLAKLRYRKPPEFINLGTMLLIHFLIPFLI